MSSSPKPKSATETDRSIGGRIAALRVAQGLSQTDLGQAIGVSFQQVQKYEKGRNRIGAGRLQAIADLLRVPVDTFFADPRDNGGGRVGPAALFEDPKVMELVLAFTSITDETTRGGILSIVKAAATLQESRAAAQRPNAVDEA